MGRWHVPGSARGWYLIEASGPEELAEHAFEWGDVIELEIHPVIDAAARAAVQKVFGK